RGSLGGRRGGDGARGQRLALAASLGGARSASSFSTVGAERTGTTRRGDAKAPRSRGNVLLPGRKFRALEGGARGDRARGFSPRFRADPRGAGHRKARRGPDAASSVASGSRTVPRRLRRHDAAGDAGPP